MKLDETMELADVEIFLVLAEELHFGHTARRTHVSTARVSQRIRAMERHIGAPLFERTSRRVRLTPLGARLRDHLRPTYARMLSVLDDARAEARSPTGRLRIGFTATTGGEPLNRLVRAFEAAHPGSEVSLHEVDIATPFEPLRAGAIDVVVNWLFDDSPDLTVGPVLDRQPRMLAVAADHVLAKLDSVSAEVLGDYPVVNWLEPFEPSILRGIVPATTPSGRPIRPHAATVRTMNEAASQIARGLAVHPTVRSMEIFRHREDVRLVPIVDLPPAPLGLIWCTAHHNARIRALAALAAQPSPVSRTNSS